MIKTIRIQNFRSLKDVTLHLQDVNLLIGPNNSGKSNLMKALQFLGEFFSDKFPRGDNLKNCFFLQRINQEDKFDYPPIIFTITDFHAVYRLELYGITTGGEVILNQLVGTINEGQEDSILENLELNNIPELKKTLYSFMLQSHNNYNRLFAKYVQHERDPLFDKIPNSQRFVVYHKGKKTNPLTQKPNEPISEFHLAQGFPTSSTLFEEIGSIFSSTKIYSINVSNLKQPYPTLEEDYSVKSDASNLVAFLDNMRDNQPQIMNDINSNLKQCIKEFEAISFEKVKLPKDHELRKIHGDKTFKRLGVQDKYGHTYWADELSDGTLYFLALLAIIYQPNPPKLLMVEEPENGIHPRRIREIVDYFFEIAEKGVQVILTTHSTVLIDRFTDIPESIFVFDKKDQSTQVRNLQYDIIAEDSIQSEKLNLPKLDLSQSIGDHWASGLIGGVPK